VVLPDGNGRTGRLWQSLILQKWQPFFAWLPMETLIYENQEAYYKALNQANLEGESTVFVQFMLSVICGALRELADEQCNKSTDEKVIAILRKRPEITLSELADELNITKRQAERIAAELKRTGAVERVGARKNGRWKVL